MFILIKALRKLHSTCSEAVLSYLFYCFPRLQIWRWISILGNKEPWGMVWFVWRSLHLCNPRFNQNKCQISRTKCAGALSWLIYHWPMDYILPIHGTQYHEDNKTVPNNILRKSLTIRRTFILNYTYLVNKKGPAQNMECNPLPDRGIHIDVWSIVAMFTFTTLPTIHYLLWLFLKALHQFQHNEAKHLFY